MFFYILVLLVVLLVVLWLVVYVVVDIGLGRVCLVFNSSGFIVCLLFIIGIWVS